MPRGGAGGGHFSCHCVVGMVLMNCFLVSVEVFWGLVHSFACSAAWDFLADCLSVGGVYGGQAKLRSFFGEKRH